MEILPARLAFYVLLPAVLGGGLAWSMRSVTAPDAGEAAASVAGTSRSAAAEATAQTGGPADFPVDSVLADQKRFCGRLQGADLTQMMALLDEAQAFADPFRRRSLRTLVFEQMARTDPAGAWALLETWEKGGYRNPFLQAWAQVDAEGALTWAEGQGKEGVDFAREIIAGLVPDNMEAFTKILPRLKPDQIGKDKIGTAFRLLGAQDSAAALRLLEGLSGNGQQNFASSSLAEGWARRDAKAAYAWAKDLTDPAQRESALRGVFRAWAETDPRGTAARLDELTKDPAMAKAAAGDSPVRAVVRAWAAQDPKAAAAWLRQRAEEGGDGSFQELLNSEILPSRDEWKATELAAILRNPGEPTLDGEQPLSSVYGRVSWDSLSGDEDEYLSVGEFGGGNSPLRDKNYPGDTSSRPHLGDPSREFDELASQPNDSTRQHMLHEVASQWAEKDPSSALTKLRQTTDEWLKLSLINALSNRARKTSDPALAAEIAATFPTPFTAQGQTAVLDVYRTIAARDPDRAKSLLAGDLDAASKVSIAAVLATQQAIYDPAGAIAWAAQQTEQPVQEKAMSSAVSGWANSDAYAASEWLSSQPAGPLREAAVEGLVHAIGMSSPDDALQWVATMTNPEQREAAQMNILLSLLQTDFSKVKRLADEIPLSTQHQQMLQQMIKSREGRGQ